MWFKVDDGLPKHRKARAVRRSHPTKARDVAPFGLWVIAGAVSDDGFVPLEVLQDWDDDAEELAARLVESGLWLEATQDGEPGYRFHDWQDYGPRVGPLVSGKRGNHIRWHEQRGKTDPECPFCEVQESPRKRSDNRGDIGAISGGDSGAISPPESGRESGGESDRVSGGDRKPDPTRPDKSSCASADAERESEPARSARASLDSEFESWYAAYPRKRGKGQASKAYRAARKKADATALLAALASQADALMARGPEYCPYPATWLTGERWTDQPDAAQVEAVGVAPMPLPEPPADVADDPARYATWLAEQRALRGRAS